MVKKTMYLQFTLVLFFVVFSIAGNAAETNWQLYRCDPQATVAPENVQLPDKLQLRWKQKLETEWVEAAPVIANGVLYAGTTDTGLRTFSMKDGKPQWTFPIESGMLIPPSYHSVDDNRFVLAGSTDGTLFAVDAAAGKQRWSFKTQGTLHNAPNIDTKTNRVLLTSEDGSLYAIDITTGKLVWEYKAEDQLRCFPTILGRYCFVSGCDSHLHTVDLDTGKCVSKIDIDAPSGTTPVVCGSTLFFGTEGNEFLAVNWNAETKEAKIVWRYAVKQAIRSPAVCSKDGLVIFCGMDKTVRALSQKDGEERWLFRTKGRMEHAGAIIIGGKIYVSSQDSTLYVLSLKDGTKLDGIELSGRPLGSPIAADNSLVIATDEGMIYCFGQ